MMSFRLFRSLTAVAIAICTYDATALVPPTTCGRCQLSHTDDAKAWTTKACCHSRRPVLSPLFLRLGRDRPNGESAFSSSPSASPNSLPPGMGLTNQPQVPYVPDGLTAAQYQEIKRREAEAASKLNYGAWGPRFKRSQRPDGDWLLQPQLWTAGFRVNPQSDENNYGSGPGWSRLRNGVQRHLAPAFLLAWIVGNVVWMVVSCSSIVSVRSQTQPAAHGVGLSIRTVAQLLFRTVLVPQVFLVPRLVATCALTVPTAKYLEWASRRRLWTQRRTCTATAAVAIAVWFAAVLVLL